MGFQEITKTLGQFSHWPNVFDPRMIRTAGSQRNQGQDFRTGAVPNVRLVTGTVSVDVMTYIQPDRYRRIAFVLELGVYAQATGASDLAVVYIDERAHMLHHTGAASVGWQILPVYRKMPRVVFYNNTGSEMAFDWYITYLPFEYFNPDIGAQTDTPMERSK